MKTLHKNIKLNNTTILFDAKAPNRTPVHIEYSYDKINKSNIYHFLT